MASSEVRPSLPLHEQLEIIASNMDGWWHDLAQIALHGQRKDDSFDAAIRRMATEEAAAIREAARRLKP